MPTLTILTLGHSNRPLREFLELLAQNDIALVADVRTIPRSRHNPQYEARALARSLKAEGVGYRHLPMLGGLRKPKRDSPNAAWRNESFRGYADYMQSESFREGISELLSLASKRRLAVVCAEAVPWRCHRNLIADALVARGVCVLHILGPGRNQAHRLTPWAKIRGGKVTYPPSRKAA